MTAPKQFLPTPDVVANPYPTYQRLLADMPTHFNDTFNYWVVTKYNDVAEVLRHSSFSARRSHMFFRQLTKEQTAEFQAMSEMLKKWMLVEDPPTHTRLRGLINQAFVPSHIERLRPKITDLTNSLLDVALEKGTFDIVEDLAHPLPVMVICDLLGTPPEDRAKMKAWSDGFATFFANPVRTYEMTVAAQSHLHNFHDYFRHLIKARRQNPQPDLLSDMIAAEEGGSHFTEDELIATCVMIIFAGHETTTNLIANGALALLNHPEQKKKLVENPNLMATAIEEFLRFDSPVQWTGRLATQELNFSGAEVKKGQLVLTGIGAANWDPLHFKSPETLDIGRQPNKHLSFGNGIHFCPGASLSRLEGFAAIKGLLDRFPNMQLSSTKLEYRPDFMFRGPKTLAVKI